MTDNKPYPEQPERVPLTDEQIESACLSYNHSFGLMNEIEQSLLMRVARDWERALEKERAHANQAPQPAESQKERAPSSYVNGAGIRVTDKPTTVVRKLDAVFHDAMTFTQPQEAAPASQDAEDAAHIKALIEVVRMPNVEHVADAHNAAVKYLRAQAKERST